MNKLFDTTYIYRDWDDFLEGKQVFVGDSWFDLLMRFNSGKTVQVEPTDNFDFPFIPVHLVGSEVASKIASYRLVYYDPALEAKIALSEGKTVIAHYLYDLDAHTQVGSDWDWQAHEDYIDFYEILLPDDKPKSDVLFDPKFVHFIWHPDLAGNLCFFADSLSSLQKQVESGWTEAMRYPKMFKCLGDELYIFQACSSPMDTSGIVNQFCYFDPLYQVKLGFHRGNPVERRLHGTFAWESDPNPSWDISRFEYRLSSH